MTTNMVDRVLSLLLVATPICYMTGMSLSGFSIPFFRIGVIALFVASLFDKPQRKMPGERIIAGFLLLCVFNVFMYRMNPVSIQFLINAFLAIMALCIVVTYSKNPKSCYKYLVAGCVINMVIWLGQKVGFNPILTNSPPDAWGGNMGNIPRLVTQIAIVMPYLLSVSVWLLIAGMAVSLVGGEYVALGVGLGLLFWKYRNQYIRSLIVLCGVVGGVRFYPHILKSILVRIEIWTEVLTAFFTRPMVGYGLGMFPYGQDKIRPMQDMVIMNSHLQFIVGAGILAVVWLFFVLRRFRGRFSPTTEGLGVLCLLAVGCIEYPFEIPRLWITIVALIGFFLIATEKRKE